MLPRFALLFHLPLLALGAAQRRATPSQFELYAYGSALGGLPMFYADGYAYLGDSTKSNSTDARPVILSPGSNDMWMGAPNNTDANSQAPGWSNVTMFVPGPGMSDMRVGFLSSSNSSNSNLITTNFRFYGQTAMVLVNGTLESPWTALETGDTGVHALYWSDTSSGQVPVAMRRAAPTEPTKHRK